MRFFIARAGKAKKHMGASTRMTKNLTGGNNEKQRKEDYCIVRIFRTMQSALLMPLKMG
ncbi:MAG: hypothetical protein MSC57_04060 [Peptoniphilaceae bacterium]|nr:hypothetical protein [Peptoniphilaceae bacterium]